MQFACLSGCPWAIEASPLTIAKAWRAKGLGPQSLSNWATCERQSQATHLESLKKNLPDASPWRESYDQFALYCQKLD